MANWLSSEGSCGGGLRGRRLPKEKKEKKKEKRKREKKKKRKKGTTNSVKLLHIKCCIFQ